MKTTTIIDDDYSKIVSEAYFAEEAELEMGIHPTQVLERIKKCLAEKNCNYSAITFLDWDGFEGTRVGVSVDNAFYGVFDYNKNQFESNYELVLLEKPGTEGLSAEECKSLIDIKLKSIDGIYPIELEAYEHECSAMGFITSEAANKVDYDYESSGLHQFIASILDDMGNESKTCEYEFKGIRIWLSR